jgi:hypothetical protein
MAYPTQEGIGEVAMGSGMAGIHFMLAVRIELLKDYEEASRAWMSEAKLWSKLAVKLYRQAPPVRIGGPAHGLNVVPLRHDRFTQPAKGAPFKGNTKTGTNQ